MSGNPGGVKQLAQELLASPLLSDAGIQVAAQNLRAHAVGTGGGKLWQARLRTRDLMRIMDCVQVRAPRALKPREGGDLKAVGSERGRMRADCLALDNASLLLHVFAHSLRVRFETRACSLLLRTSFMPFVRADSATFAGCTGRWARSG